jgi:hypothetical protein
LKKVAETFGKSGAYKSHAWVLYDICHLAGILTDFGLGKGMEEKVLVLYKKLGMPEAGARKRFSFERMRIIEMKVSIYYSV